MNGMGRDPSTGAPRGASGGTPNMPVAPMPSGLPPLAPPLPRMPPPPPPPPPQVTDGGRDDGG
jgi:hypothetical protein